MDWMRAQGLATAVIQACALTLLIELSVRRYIVTRRFGARQAIALTIAVLLGVAASYELGLKGEHAVTLAVGAIIGVVIVTRNVHRRSLGTSDRSSSV